MIYFSHLRIPSNGTHLRTRKINPFSSFHCDCCFSLSLNYCFVLRWRFHSPFNVSLEMNTSGFAGNILCVHLDLGAGVSILAILVYNRGRFCTLILNILMKCKKRTDQYDTSKSIYILNQLDIEFVVRALTVLRKQATHPSPMFLRVPPDLDTELLLKLHDICTFVW